MLRPQRPKRQPLPKVLIVCEGDVSERIYFHGVRSHRRIPRTRMELHLGVGDPMNVVKRAISLRNSNLQQNKIDHITVEDAVWVVFDRDTFDNIPPATALARSNGIKVAFSNPNFELFLLLHFQDQDRAENGHRVISLLKKHIRRYDKSYDYEALGLHDLYLKAIDRATRINRRSDLRDGIQMPPFTSLIDLVDYLRIF